MDGIISLLRGIGDAIVSIFDFIVSFFQDIVYMIQLTGKVVLSIPDYFSWLPGELVTLLVILFGIVVIYKILGREG